MTDDDKSKGRFFANLDNLGPDELALARSFFSDYAAYQEDKSDVAYGWAVLTLRMVDALEDARRQLAEARRDYKRLLNERVEATHDLAVKCETERAAGRAEERADVVAGLSAAAANADSSVTDEDCELLDRLPVKTIEVIGSIASAQLCKALIEKIEAGRHVGAARRSGGEERE